MTTADILWICNGLIFLGAVTMLAYVLSGHRERVRHLRDTYLQKANVELDRIAPSREVADLWQKLLSSVVFEDRAPSRMRLIVALRDVAPTESQLCTVEESVIHPCNEIANLIDCGLLRARDLVETMQVRKYVDVLSCLKLTEPLVWYQSLVRVRGRWGYRPLQLLGVLDQLRAGSGYDDVRGRIAVDVGGGSWTLFEPITWWHKLFARVRYLIKSPTVDLRSKLHLKKEARRLRALLNTAGAGESGAAYQSW
jgi:hypothetical protein